MNWTVEEYQAYCARTGQTPEIEAKKQSKYKNVRTDGYDSKHEAERAGELKLLLQAGEIAGLFEQVPFKLAGGVVYIADFVILEWDGTFKVEDAKGVRTKEYNIKKRLMIEKGLDIVEV